MGTESPPEIEIAKEVMISKVSSAVIVVDKQNDFAKEEGKLYVPDTQKTIEPIKVLLGKARSADVPIIFTQDWHRPDDPEFNIWPPHAVQGTPGAEVIADFNASAKDFFIKKRTYDAFYGTDMDLLLRQMGIKDVIIVGTVSNICVLHTAEKARLNGYNVIMPKDGISSLTRFDQNLTLRQVSWPYSGKITTVDAVKFH